MAGHRSATLAANAAFSLSPLHVALRVVLLSSLLLAGCATQRTHEGGIGLADAQAAYARQDFTAAARILEPLALQGDPDAQYALGYMYFYGQGVPQSERRATSWFSEATRTGHPKAQSALDTLIERSRLTRMPPAAQRRALAQTEAAAQAQPPVAAPEPEVVAEPEQTDAVGAGEGVSPVPSALPEQGETPLPPVRVPVPLRVPPRESSLIKASLGSPALSATQPPMASTPPSSQGRPAIQVASVAANPVAVAVKKAVPRFTLQLLSSPSKQDLLRLVEEHALEDAEYFQADYKGRQWYGLVHGGFDTLADARAALDALPEALRKHQPLVRNYSATSTKPLKADRTG